MKTFKLRIDEAFAESVEEIKADSEVLGHSRTTDKSNCEEETMRRDKEVIIS